MSAPRRETGKKPANGNRLTWRVAAEALAIVLFGLAGLYIKAVGDDVGGLRTEVRELRIGQGELKVALARVETTLDVTVRNLQETLARHDRQLAAMEGGGG